MFVTVNILQNVLYMFLISLSITFLVIISSITNTKPKAKYRFCVATMLLC